MRELALVSSPSLYELINYNLTFWYRPHNLFPCPPNSYLAGRKPVQTLFLDQSQALKTKSQDRRRNSYGFWWLSAEFVQRDAFLVRTTNLGVCEVGWNNGHTGSSPVLSPVILFITKNTFRQRNPKQKHKTQQQRLKRMNWLHQCQTQRESITNSAYQTADKELRNSMQTAECRPNGDLPHWRALHRPQVLGTGPPRLLQLVEAWRPWQQAAQTVSRRGLQ